MDAHRATQEVFWKYHDQYSAILREIREEVSRLAAERKPIKDAVLLSKTVGRTLSSLIEMDYSDGPSDGRFYAMYDLALWSSLKRLQPEEWILLIGNQVAREQNRLERLSLSRCDVNGEKRAAIPEDVRTYVWQRDGGRCATCGSRERLEFDHIIPVAKGGGNTARNIELLCESCNRSKSDSI